MGEGRDSYLESKKDRAFKQLSRCKEVRDTLKTMGWVKIIEPLIEKMIIDIVGGKVAGRWVGGTLSDTKHVNEKEFLLGNKQFGIDLLNRIYSFIDKIEKKENEIKSYDKELNAPYMTPMLEHPEEIMNTGYEPPKKESASMPKGTSYKGKSKRKRRKKK